MAKILVADDNSNIQKMVGLALKDQGIDVVAVGNGEAAVRKIADLKPDLVLADVFMPVRNGYEVCRFVKEDPALAHIPVILLVGAFDPLDEQEAQRSGADGVLKKPFVPPDPLISMVKSALARAGVALGNPHAAEKAEKTESWEAECGGYSFTRSIEIGGVKCREIAGSGTGTVRRELCNFTGASEDSRRHRTFGIWKSAGYAGSGRRRGIHTGKTADGNRGEEELGQRKTKKWKRKTKKRQRERAVEEVGVRVATWTGHRVHSEDEAVESK